MNSKNPHDPVPAALRAWRIQPTRNPDFRPGVAARLRRGREPLGHYLRAHPAALAALIVLSLAGAWAGRVSARAHAGQAALDYVRTQDARWMVLR